LRNLRKEIVEGASPIRPHEELEGLFGRLPPLVEYDEPKIDFCAVRGCAVDVRSVQRLSGAPIAWLEHIALTINSR
jgi:hypothetical protein